MQHWLRRLSVLVVFICALSLAKQAFAQTITLTFESNGGTAIEAIQVEAGEPIFDVPKPFKAGYRFNGWYTDKKLKKRWDGEGITRNQTLYAKWTAYGKQLFYDTKDHWAGPMIDALANAHIIDGYADGTFRPNDTVLRKHAALILDRALDFTPIQETPDFKDVPVQHFYYATIMHLADAGVLTGENGRFYPDREMTRAQMAKMLVLAYKLPLGTQSTFQDVAPSSWSYGYIAALEAAGITQGIGTEFRPNDFVTRAEFAAFLYRAQMIY